MSSAITAEDGLRERKRAALRAGIERIAVDLTIEHGYDHLTVDMICDAGMISQRTFFNYFGSKEGVILGSTPPMPSEEQIAAFAHASGADVLGDFVALITSSVVDHEPDAELFRLRRAIILQTPELSSKETARMGELEEQFVRIVLTRFEAQGRDAAEPGLEDEARMVVALTIGVMHLVMRKWFSEDSASSTRELLQQSAALIQRVTGNDTAHS